MFSVGKEAVAASIGAAAPAGRGAGVGKGLAARAWRRSWLWRYLSAWATREVRPRRPRTVWSTRPQRGHGVSCRSAATAAGNSDRRCFASRRATAPECFSKRRVRGVGRAREGSYPLRHSFKSAQPKPPVEVAHLFHSGRRQTPLCLHSPLPTPHSKPARPTLYVPPPTSKSQLPSPHPTIRASTWMGGNVSLF